MLDGAFSHFTWIGDTLWAATDWDGVHSIQGDDKQFYDEERAGAYFSDVKAMAATAPSTFWSAVKCFRRRTESLP